MRILQLHCDSIEYTPIKKEIKIAKDLTDTQTCHLDEVVVAFISIERGDNSNVVQDAVSQITESMNKVGCRHLLLYPYAHLSSDLASPGHAIKLLDEMEKATFDLDVSCAPFGWTKSYNIKVKGHPLAETSKVISSSSVTSHESVDTQEDTSTALQHESTIQSSWKIMTPDGVMVDIDQFDFTNHKKLEKLAKYESEKSRNVDEAPPHVSLMKKLGIADYESASDSGNMRFFPNGRLIKSLIERYVTDRVKEYGGSEVETPIMYDSEHPSMVSYFNRFPARQYSIDSEGKRLFLRFAACFGQFLMANHFQLSYKNLPYKLYELTRYSFRREQSGELVGLRRLRAFTMPDCHAFCADMQQAISELRKRFILSQSVLDNLGIERSDYEMAIRFTEDFYNENHQMIEDMIKQHNRPVLVEMWKEKFFYFVLKWEFNFIDNMGKASALSTDQIDVENGARYGIEFANENNIMINPIILHNSPSGAIERIIYALLEKAASDTSQGQKPQLPLWLAPTQIRIIPITEEFNDYCEKLVQRLTAENIRVDMDERNESIGKRIRDAEKEWIQYILVIGKREIESTNLSIRDRQMGTVRNITFDDLLGEIRAKTANKPYTMLNLPYLLSKRPQIMV